MWREALRHYGFRRSVNVAARRAGRCPMWRSVLCSVLVAGGMAAAPLSAGASVGPANDDFANAEELGSDASGCASGDNTGATLETDEPQVASGDSPSVWYAWTAPADGQVTFAIYLHGLSD